MDTLPDWLETVIRLTGWTLLHFVWQGAVIGAVYALMRRRLPAGDARYACGLVALAAMVLAPLVTVAWLASRMATDGGLVATTAGMMPATPKAAGTLATASWASFDALLPWLVAVWFAGVLLLGTRAAVHWQHLRRLVRIARPFIAWEERFAALCRRFGLSMSVRLAIVEGIDTPTLIGWLRPVILLPTAIVLGFPADQIELVLAHELGHVRRRDAMVNLVQVVVETVLFYHPVVHWISRDLRNERELACDALVLRTTAASPRRYAQMLADLEDLRVAPRGWTLALAASGGVLLERVRRIVGEPADAGTFRPAGRLLPLVLIGAVLAMLAMREVRRLPDADVAALLAAPWQSIGRIMPAASAPGLRVADLDAKPRLAIHLPQAVESGNPTSLPAATSATPAMPASVPASSAIAEPVRPPAVADTKIARVMENGVAAPATLAPTTRIAAERPTSSAEPRRPRRVVQPTYPSQALQDGIEGEVDLEFGLTAQGEVQDIRVIAAQPARVFEAAAVQALRRWRYDPDPIGAGSERFRQSFVFALGGLRKPLPLGSEDLAAQAGCRIVTGSRICRRDEPGSGSP